MKLSRKIISMTMVVAIALSMGACSKGNEKVEENEVVNTESSTMASEKPITLTYFEYSASPFKTGNPVAKKLEEYTNVKLEGIMSENMTDPSQAYNLMVTSGDIGDLVYFARTELFRDGQDGAYLPLQDLVAEHAPNIQKMFEMFPEAKSTATDLEGNLLYIPTFKDGATAEGYYIRQDWLDRLGLETPKTVDDFYTVLKAFKDEDANGNGDKNDEIPFFSRNNRSIEGVLSFLFDSNFNRTTSGLYIDGTEIKYGAVEPQFKVAMETLAKWYAEGLIDPEIFTRAGTARDVMLNDNIGGVTHDWFASTAEYNNKLEGTIEGFNLAPMLPPASISGKIVEPTRRASGFENGTAISSSCEDPIAAIKFLDFCFTEEARTLLNFGIEGEDYTMVDGKPMLTESILKAENGALSALRDKGAQLEMSFHQDFEYEKQWMNPIAKDGMELYLNEDCLVPEMPALNLTVEQATRYNQLLGPIDTYVTENIQKWILGAEDINKNFDNFVKEINKMGLEEMLKIQNDAYKQ